MAIFNINFNPSKNISLPVLGVTSSKVMHYCNLITFFSKYTVLNSVIALQLQLCCCLCYKTHCELQADRKEKTFFFPTHVCYNEQGEGKYWCGLQLLESGDMNTGFTFIA